MKNLLTLTFAAVLAVSSPVQAATDGHGHSAEQSSGHDNEQNHNENPEQIEVSNAQAGHGSETNEEQGHAEKAEAEKDGHGHAEEGGHNEEGGSEEAGGEVGLTPENMKTAGIVVEALVLQNLEDEVQAPGEVTLNSYLSSKVTPRIKAQVVARHAKLGETVEKGQPLVTLTSVDMAVAIGESLVAHKEWRRVQQLGSSAVSAKRYSEAKIADIQARAKVMAYGMTKEQIKTLHKKGSDGNPGAFQLVAPQEGTIVSDEFIEGELIEPGRVLFDIVNESSLWIESQISPELAKKVDVGANARVYVPGKGWLQGKVIQKHHLLDKETRTIGIRVEVGNEEDFLHPGMYVDTKIQTGHGQKYLAVPTAAVLRSPDGDWVVFVEKKPGEFKPQEIEKLRTVKDYTVVKGISEGTRIVTEGAFFVQSELAKSGFSVHNH